MNEEVSDEFLKVKDEASATIYEAFLEHEGIGEYLFDNVRDFKDLETRLEGIFLNLEEKYKVSFTIKLKAIKKEE